MELEAEVQKLKEQNQELERKQVSFLILYILQLQVLDVYYFNALPVEEHCIFRHSEIGSFSMPHVVGINRVPVNYSLSTLLLYFSG